MKRLSPSKISSYLKTSSLSTSSNATVEVTATALAHAVDVHKSPPKKKLKIASTDSLLSPTKENMAVDSKKSKLVVEKKILSSSCIKENECERSRMPPFLFRVAEVRPDECHGGSITLALKRIESDDSREYSCILADSWYELRDFVFIIENCSNTS